MYYYFTKIHSGLEAFMKLHFSLSFCITLKFLICVLHFLFFFGIIPTYLHGLIIFWERCHLYCSLHYKKISIKKCTCIDYMVIRAPRLLGTLESKAWICGDIKNQPQTWNLNVILPNNSKYPNATSKRLGSHCVNENQGESFIPYII